MIEFDIPGRPRALPADNRLPVDPPDWELMTDELELMTPTEEPLPLPPPIKL